jgi:hypothetical protein
MHNDKAVAVQNLVKQSIKDQETLAMLNDKKDNELRMMVDYKQNRFKNNTEKIRHYKTVKNRADDIKIKALI